MYLIYEKRGITPFPRPNLEIVVWQFFYFFLEYISSKGGDFLRIIVIVLFSLLSSPIGRIIDITLFLGGGCDRKDVLLTVYIICDIYIHKKNKQAGLLYIQTHEKENKSLNQTGISRLE